MKYNENHLMISGVTKLKKRLRKISLFDMVIFFTGFLILAGGSFLLMKKDKWITIEIKYKSNEYKSVYYNQLNTSPFNWAIDGLSVGDAEYGSFGSKIAYITDIHSWGDMISETWITLRIKAAYDRTKKSYRYNYQTVSIGQPMRFNLKNTTVDGVVTRIEGQKDPRKYEDKIVLAKLIDNSQKRLETTGVDQWVAEAINPGEKMFDNHNRLVAEVLETDIQPAQRITVDAGGKAYSVADPALKDVVLKLRLKTTKNNGTNYFLEDWPVKVNLDLPLVFTSINIAPRIIRVL